MESNKNVIFYKYILYGIRTMTNGELFLGVSTRIPSSQPEHGTGLESEIERSLTQILSGSVRDWIR